MEKIFHFKEIGEYLQALNLQIESKLPDFFIYRYEHVNFNNCAHLAAYRHNYFEINFEAIPGCNIQVDQFNLPNIENRLTLVSPFRLQSIMAHSNTSEPAKGYGIFFKPEFISASYDNSNLLKDFPFFSRINSPSLALKNGDADEFNDIADKIQHEYDNHGQFSDEIIKNYLNILFLKAGKHYGIHLHPTSGNRDLEIYQEFEWLVQKHFLEFNSVKDYADKLHISAKHLSETVKKVSNESALRIIHKAQLNYAKALLLQTYKTVSEIAYELNFENPDYFSAFFKRLTGKSPLQFRVSS